MSIESAVALLQQESGKALDPKVVETFMRILPALRAQVQRLTTELPALPSADLPTSVFEDIALAHREIYALYQIAQTMGTSLGVHETMAVIASKLTELVPFSACALFLYTESTETLHCRFATGGDGPLFEGIEVRSGLARAERLNAEVSLLVLDLDDFKEINDTFGHHIGDRALREAATALRAAIRPYDICVRYAGDEFIVVLSGCGREEAERKRLELQQAVDNVEIEVRPDLRIPMMISSGAAAFPHDGNGYEALLAKADSRMYRDKSQRKA